MTALQALFAPRSIAVVGASEAEEKPGAQLMRVLENFPGELIPINPKALHIFGRNAYASLSAVGRPVDLAVLAVPAGASPDVLEDGGRAGLKAAVIISGGFAEAGDEGIALQTRLRQVCTRYGIRLLGPNTSGYAAPGGATVCFVPGVEKLPPGGLAVVAQSGSVNLTLAFMAANRGLGVRLAVGLGNAMDVDAAAVLRHLADDDATQVIALHLEGLADGRALFEAVANVTRKKPVLALTVGRGDIGAFAQSHTGNLIGQYALKAAALAQAGALVMDDSDSLIDAAQLFLTGRMRPHPSPGIAIVTGQAGTGLIMLDCLKAAGVAVPPLSPATVEAIAGHLPPLTYLHNPVDTGRPGPSFGPIMDLVAEDSAIDAVLAFAIHEPAAFDPLTVLQSFTARHAKPLVFGTSGLAADVSPTLTALQARGIAGYAGPERAACAMARLVEDAVRQSRRLETATPLNQLQLPPLPTTPDEASAKAFLAAAGIATPKGILTANLDEALAALAHLRPPVVLKAVHPQILHKTEMGAVRLGLRTADELRAAFAAMAAQLGGYDGVRYLVEEMAGSGVDMILGVRRDPVFGPVVLVGLGGTEAELYKDTALRLAPVGAGEALHMIDELKARELLAGWRGAPAADVHALAGAVATLSQIISQCPQIVELEINPLRVLPRGILALDALMVVTLDPSKA